MPTTKTKTTQTLTQQEARQIALAGQGFARARPKGRVDARHLRKAVRELGAIQLDYVDTLVESHYITIFSRVGPYPRELLDELVYQRRNFTEAWVHQASIVPVELWPLIRDGGGAEDRRIAGLVEFAEAHPDYLEQVLDEVRSEGPLAPSEIPSFEDTPRVPAGGWGWTVPRMALEALFFRGDVAVAERLDDLSRAFDLADRVVQKKHVKRKLDRTDAQRELVATAATALGVATPGDLAEYFDLPVSVVKERVAELVDAGTLNVVEVEHWREPGYLARGAGARSIKGGALLAPFDPLLWSRPRLRRLFDFDYRVEISVPRAKRQWGNYVLPFLHEDGLVARVDLEADRKKGILEVLAAYLEQGADGNAVSESLAEELHTMAEWLGLEEVNVGRRGSLVIPLRGAVENA